MSVVATLAQPKLYMPEQPLKAKASYGEITDNNIYGVELTTTDFYGDYPLANCFATKDPYYKVKAVEWYRITADNRLEAVTGTLDVNEEYYAKIKLTVTEAGSAAGKLFSQARETADSAMMRFVCGSVNGRPVLKAARGVESGVIVPYMLCYMGKPACRLLVQDGATAYNADQVGIDGAMAGDRVTLKAPAEKDGRKFSRWLIYTMYEGARNANVDLSMLTDEIYGEMNDTELSFAMPACSLEFVPVYAGEDQMVKELTISGFKVPEEGKHLNDMPDFGVSIPTQMVYAGWGFFREEPEGASPVERFEFMESAEDIAQYGNHYGCMIGVMLNDGNYFSPSSLTIKGMPGEPVAIYNSGTTVTLFYDFGYFCPEGLWIKPVAAQDYTGQAVKPAVEVFCDSVLLQENTDYSVSYKNNIKAADSTDKNAPTIIVTGKKNYKGKETAAFTIKPADLGNTPGITAEKVTVAYNGKQIWGKPVVKFHGRTIPSSEYTLEYLNKDDTNAFCKPGSYTIRITGRGKNFTGTMTCIQTVAFKLSTKNVKMEKVEAVYTGSPVILPTGRYAVRSEDGKTTLIQGIDYEIRYRNNTEAGTATAEFVGLGSYGGVVKKTFKITPKELCPEMVTNAPATCIYQKSGVFPAGYEVQFATVKLTEGVDYTVKHINNKAVADKSSAKAPTIQITGKGNYKGTVNIKYSIQPADLQDALNGTKGVEIESVYYKDGKNNYKPKYTLKDAAGNRLAEKKDFTAEYFYYDEDKDALVSVTGDRVNMPAGKEIVEMMVTFNGVGNYSGTLDARYFLFSRQMKDVVVEPIPNQIYTGKPIDLFPYLKITDKKTGKLLEEAWDYIVEYRNNSNAGTATAIIKGNYNYVGEIRKTFKIEKAVLGTLNKDGSTTPGESIQIQMTPAACTYTGEAQKPTDFSVTYLGSELIAGRDYTVSYKNNTKASVGAAPDKAPAVVLTGKGNFTGKLKLCFDIQPADLTTCAITAKDLLYKDVSNNYKAAPVLTTLEGKKLKAGTDYEKECSYYTESDDGSQTPVTTDRITMGSRKEIVMAVTVTGKGNYQGSAQAIYRIYCKDLSKAAVAKVESQVYTGSQLKPKVTVTYGKEKKLLQENTDYILRYENNENAGTATVYIMGIGEYGGERKVTFKILPREMTWWEEFLYTTAQLFK